MFTVTVLDIVFRAAIARYSNASFYLGSHSHDNHCLPSPRPVFALGAVAPRPDSHSPPAQMRKEWPERSVGGWFGVIVDAQPLPPPSLPLTHKLEPWWMLIAGARRTTCRTSNERYADHIPDVKQQRKFVRFRRQVFKLNFKQTLPWLKLVRRFFANAPPIMQTKKTCPFSSLGVNSKYLHRYAVVLGV